MHVGAKKISDNIQKKGEEKIMKKRLLAALLTGTLTLSALAGCGAAGSASAETADEKNAVADVTESSDRADTVATGSEVVQLHYPCIWVGADSKANVWKKIIDGFNEEYAGVYEVVIEEQTDYDLYAQKINTQVTTGDVPDIFTVGAYSYLELYAETGKLMDLTDFLYQDDVYEKFNPGAIEAAQVGGVNYAFPYENAVIPILFNQSILDEYGLAVPTSFEELAEEAKVLQDNGVYAYTESTADNAWFAMLWYSYAVAALGGPDVYERGLDDPAFVEAAEIVKEQFQYTSPDAIGADAQVANGHFFNERSAFYTNGSWILGRIKSEGVEGLYDKLTVSPGLSVDGKNGNGFINQGQAYFAAAKQDDPAKQAAVEAFFKYIIDPDRVLELSLDAGALFAINVDATAYTDPVQSAIIEQSANADFSIGTFSGSVSTAVAEEFQPALEALLLDEITAEEFVQQLKDADH